MKRFTNKIKSQRGFTLIELVAAIAISVIVLSMIAGIFTMTYKTFDSSVKQAEAQNLAVLTVQKIQSEVRNCKSVTIYNYDSATKMATPEQPSTETQFCFDDSIGGFMLGSDTFLKDSFHNYNCKLIYDCPRSNVLNVAITIRDKKNNQLLYNSATNIYLLSGSVTKSPSIPTGKDANGISILNY